MDSSRPAANAQCRRAVRAAPARRPALPASGTITMTEARTHLAREDRLQGVANKVTSAQSHAWGEKRDRIAGSGGRFSRSVTRWARSHARRAALNTAATSPQQAVLVTPVTACSSRCRAPADHGALVAEPQCSGSLALSVVGLMDALKRMTHTPATSAASPNSTSASWPSRPTGKGSQADRLALHPPRPQ
jgi:hypothetical protein